MLKVALEKECLKSGYRFPSKRKTSWKSSFRDLGDTPGNRFGQILLRKNYFSDEVLQSMVSRMVGLEQGIFELKELLIASKVECALAKARELTGLAAKSGSSDAMKICIAIQLVGRQGLLQRAFELAEELLVGVKAFKENLIIEGA